MSHKKRIEDLLAGKKLDSPSMNLWKHFPPYDEEVDQLIKKTIQFQERFSFDFVKVTYQGLYSIQDWGSKIKWPERDSKWPDTCSKVGVVTDPSIKNPEDWEKLSVKTMHEKSWADTIAAAKGIYEHYKGKVPVVVTVFNPSTTAAKMSGDKFVTHMRENPDAVKKGLDVISDTTQLFIEELIKIGVDGIFFATQLGTYDRITEKEYDFVGTPYDKRIIDRVNEKIWFNIMHMHGNEPMFEKLSKYPLQAINWHDRLVKDYDIKTGRKICPGRLLIGGIDEFGILKNGTDAELKNHIIDAFEQSGDGNIILGPGCCVPLDVSEDRIELAKKILAGL